MTALWVIPGIFLFLFLLGQIRVGGSAKYNADGAMVFLKIGPYRRQVYPAAPGEKNGEDRKTGKKEKEEEKKAEEETTRQGGSLGLILELVPVAVEAVGFLFRKIRVDKLELHLVWAAEDPAAAAMGYGAANAAMGALIGPLESAFSIRKREIDIAVDFDRTRPEVWGEAALTLTVGQILALLIRFGWRAYKIWKGPKENRSGQQTKKEATAHE